MSWGFAPLALVPTTWYYSLTLALGMFDIYLQSQTTSKRDRVAPAARAGVQYFRLLARGSQEAETPKLGFLTTCV